MHYGLDPTSEASKLVNGRELTADDVVEAIKHGIYNQVGYLYRSNPELRTIEVVKTGPWEVTFNLPLSSLVSAMSRIGELQRIYAPEVRGKGTDWHSQVGSGPFMLTGYVSGSSLTFTKNPNYWGTDPIGPGKGNKVPYVDSINVFIITDPSTRAVAFRTGKIDMLSALDFETTAQFKKEFPQMPRADIGDWYSPGGGTIYMRTDKAPYNDVRVRRALMMATDFNTIKQSINGGMGDIITFPFSRYAGLEGLYAGIDDPELTPAIKEQFVYSPDKAKALLAEAGFPNGFKTNVLITSSQSSYYEMIASMWAKAGITLDIKVMDQPVLLNLLNAQGLTDLTSGTGFAPASIYYTGNIVNGVPGGATNLSYVDDPLVKELLPKIRTFAATDPDKALPLAKQIMLRALDQAWAVQIPKYRTSTFWQPWLKNYSGEISVGYYSIGNWSRYAWIDQTLKK
jgi:peptide/nickel transport system substrate-binding protein